MIVGESRMDTREGPQGSFEGGLELKNPPGRPGGVADVGGQWGKASGRRSIHVVSSARWWAHEPGFHTASRGSRQLALPAVLCS